MTGFIVDYWYWAAWLGLFFLPAELYAAKATPKKPDTFSEFIWWSFGVRRDPKPKWYKARRFIMHGMMFSLWGHFLYEWSAVPVMIFGAGVGAVLVRALIFERRSEMPKYSAVTGVKKAGKSIFEIILAIAVASLPQIVSVILDVMASTPAAELNVPAGWAMVWFAAIRFANNWWKNRNLGKE